MSTANDDRVIPATDIPYAPDGPFTLYADAARQRATLDVTADGTIAHADDATAEELRNTLSLMTAVVLHLRTALARCASRTPIKIYLDAPAVERMMHRVVQAVTDDRDPPPEPWQAPT